MVDTQWAKDLAAQWAEEDAARAAPKPTVSQNKGAIGDFGTSLKQGALQVPGALTGIADIPAALVTGSRPFDAATDWIGEKTGFQPGKWAKEAEAEKSPALQQARQNVDQAWKDGGFWNIAGAYAENPRTILDTIGQSLPAMVAGGVMGRAAMGAGANSVSATAGGMGPALPGVMARQFGDDAARYAAGFGEGAITAGMAMDQMPDTVDPRTAAIASLGAGALTGVIGAQSGKLAQRIGLPDPEVAIAQGGLGQASRMPWYQALPATMFREGVLEEFPQSYQEQMWQNWAQDKPLTENALRHGVEGMFAGMGQAGMVGSYAQMRGMNRDLLQETPPPAPINTQGEPQQPLGALPAPMQQPIPGMSTADGYAGFSGESMAQVAQREADRYAREAAVRQADLHAAELYAARDQHTNMMEQRGKGKFDWNNQQNIPMPMDEGAAVAIINLVSHRQALGVADPVDSPIMQAFARAIEMVPGYQAASQEAAKQATATTSATAQQQQEALHPMRSTFDEWVQAVRTQPENQRPSEGVFQPGRLDTFFKKLESATTEDDVETKLKEIVNARRGGKDDKDLASALLEQIAARRVAAQKAEQPAMNVDLTGTTPPTLEDTPGTLAHSLRMAREEAATNVVETPTPDIVEPTTPPVTELPYMGDTHNVDGKSQSSPAQQFKLLAPGVDYTEEQKLAVQKLLRSAPLGALKTLQMYNEGQSFADIARSRLTPEQLAALDAPKEALRGNSNLQAAHANARKQFKSYENTAQQQYKDLKAAFAKNGAQLGLTPEMVEYLFPTQKRAKAGGADVQTATTAEIMEAGLHVPGQQRTTQATNETEAVQEMDQELAAEPTMETQEGSGEEAIRTETPVDEAEAGEDVADQVAEKQEAARAEAPRSAEWDALSDKDKQAAQDAWNDMTKGAVTLPNWSELADALKAQFYKLQNAYFNDEVSDSTVYGKGTEPGLLARHYGVSFSQRYMRAMDKNGYHVNALRPVDAKQQQVILRALMNLSMQGYDILGNLAGIHVAETKAKGWNAVVYKNDEGKYVMLISPELLAKKDWYLEKDVYHEVAHALDDSQGARNYSSAEALQEGGAVFKELMDLYKSKRGDQMQSEFITNFLHNPFGDKRLSTTQRANELFAQIMAAYHIDPAGLNEYAPYAYAFARSKHADLTSRRQDDSRVRSEARGGAESAESRSGLGQDQTAQGRTSGHQQKPAASAGQITPLPGQYTLITPVNPGDRETHFALVTQGFGDTTLDPEPDFSSTPSATARDIGLAEDDHLARTYLNTFWDWIKSSKVKTRNDLRMLPVNRDWRETITHVEGAIKAKDLLKLLPRMVWDNFLTADRQTLNIWNNPESAARQESNALNTLREQRKDSILRVLGNTPANISAMTAHLYAHVASRYTIKGSQAVKIAKDNRALPISSVDDVALEAFEAALHEGATLTQAFERSYAAGPLSLRNDILAPLGETRTGWLKFEGDTSYALNIAVSDQVDGAIERGGSPWCIAESQDAAKGYLEGTGYGGSTPSAFYIYFENGKTLVSARVDQATGVLREWSGLGKGQSVPQEHQHLIDTLPPEVRVGEGYKGQMSEPGAKTQVVPEAEAKAVFVEGDAPAIARMRDESAYEVVAKVKQNPGVAAEILGIEDQQVVYEIADALLTGKHEGLYARDFGITAPVHHAQKLLGEPEFWRKVRVSIDDPFVGYGTRLNRAVMRDKKVTNQQSAWERHTVPLLKQLEVGKYDDLVIDLMLDSPRTLEEISRLRKQRIELNSRRVSFTITPDTRLTMGTDLEALVENRWIVLNESDAQALFGKDADTAYEAAKAEAMARTSREIVRKIQSTIKSGPKQSAEGYLNREWTQQDEDALQNAEPEVADEFFRNEVDFSQNPPMERMLEPARQMHASIKSLSRVFYQIPFLQDLAALAKDVIPAVKEYADLMAQKGALKRHYEVKIQEVLNQFGQLSKEQRHAAQRFMHDSTINGKWGYQPTWRDAIEIDPVFKSRWNSLDKGVRAVVDSVFKHGYEMLKAKRDEINKEVTSEYDAQIAIARNANEPQEVIDKLLAERKDALRMYGTFLAEVTGPYVSLRRFGDYVVVWRSPELKAALATKDMKRVEQLEQDSNHYQVVFADTAARADQITREWAKAGLKDSSYFVKAEWYNSIEEMPFMVLQRLKHAAAGNSDTKMGRALNRLLTEVYIQALAEGSARKSELARREIGGYDPQDLMRGFALQGDADSHFIASLRLNGKVQSAISAIRDQASKSPDRDKANRILNEIAARHNAMQNYTPTPIQDAIMSFNSVWYLLTSPGFYFQQITQPFMMSHPMLAGTHGWSRSFSELVKGFRELGSSGLLQEMAKNFTGKTGEVALNLNRIKNRVGNEVGMLELLREYGLIDIGLDSDMGFLRSTNPLGKVLGSVTHRLGLIARNAEIINRVSTALAAYRLTYEKTAGTAEQKHAAASEYAKQVIEQTHGNYAGFNAPGFMQASRYQGWPIKAMTQFRKFQIIQLSMLARQFNDAFFSKTATQVEKDVARTTLKWLFAHFGVMTGALGLPLANVLGIVLVGAGGDDEPKDAEYRARKALMDAGASKEMADILLHGAPMALGMNLTNKIGMANTFSVLPFTDVDLTKKQSVGELSLALLGPAGGLAGKFADGAGLISKGDVWKGYEMLMPKGIGDGMKAIRFATEGVTNRKGDVLLSPEEISFMQAVMQGLGLPPAELQHRQWQQGVAIEFQQALQDNTAELRHRYAAAAKDRDTEEMSRIRDEFSDLRQRFLDNGIKPPQMGVLFKAPQEQRKRELKVTEGGLPYIQSNRQFVENLDTL